MDASTPHVHNHVSVDQRRLRISPGTVWFLFDLIVPTALFYIAVGFGVGLYWALLGSAALSAITGLVSWIRGDRRESSVFMVLVALLGLGIALVTGSDRFLLARESVITALAGGWFLWSIRSERPLTFRFTKPLLQGRWNTTPDWDGLWQADPAFRRIWRVSSAMWGIATLIDAVLRVVIAYTMPILSVPLLQTGLMIVTMVLMQVVTNVYYVRSGMWHRLHAHALR